jgi:hypothetical protein
VLYVAFVEMLKNDSDIFTEMCCRISRLGAVDEALTFDVGTSARIADEGVVAFRELEGCVAFRVELDSSEADNRLEGGAPPIKPQMT